MIEATRSAKAKRTAGAVLAALGWSALLLQYGLLVARPSHDVTALEATVRYFSYFTVQANILVAMVLTAFAIKAGRDEWLVHPFVRSAVAVYIATVAVVYVTVLRVLWSPQGGQLLADLLLHYVMPLSYLVFWLFWVRKAGLRWYDPLLWLVYPLFYLAFIVIRGKWSGFYPYPFLDVGALGYARAALNACGIMMVFVALGALVVVIGRFSAR
jgi:hypothetical protein